MSTLNLCDPSRITHIYQNGCLRRTFRRRVTTRLILNLVFSRRGDIRPGGDDNKKEKKKEHCFFAFSRPAFYTRTKIFVLEGISLSVLV